MRRLFMIVVLAVPGAGIVMAADPIDPPFLVQQREQRDALLRELAAAPVADVRGIVAESGVGASKLRGDAQWTITLVLERWRLGDGPVRERRLVLREAGDDARLHALRSATPPYQVLRVAARVVEHDGADAQGLIERVAGVVEDEELAAIATKLQETVVHDDDVLGRLTLDRRLNWYTGRTRWGGADVRVALDSARPGDLERAAGVARSLWRDQAHWDRRIRAYVVAELLELANDTWLDDDEAVDGAQLLDRITLESITIHPDGRLEFWFDDGDLFGGHSIQVRCDLAKGPLEAVLAG